MNYLERNNMWDVVYSLLFVYYRMFESLFGLFVGVGFFYCKFWECWLFLDNLNVLNIEVGVCIDWYNFE